MIWLCQAMLDAMAPTCKVERLAAQHGGGPCAVLRQIGELDAIVRESHRDPVREAATSSSRKAIAVTVSASRPLIPGAMAGNHDR
jgi:hypothetical protein